MKTPFLSLLDGAAIAADIFISSLRLEFQVLKGLSALFQ
jgi:hypothetical protein